MLNTIGKEGNGKPSHEFHFPRKKLRVLSLVSATLEIEYATQFYKSGCIKQSNPIKKDKFKLKIASAKMLYLL